MVSKWLPVDNYYLLIYTIVVNDASVKCALKVSP